MGFFSKIASNAPQGIRIVPYTEEIAVELASKLSEINLRELKALTDISPIWALSLTVRYGENYAIYSSDGKLCGAFGVVPEENIKDCAAIWMVTTPDIKNIATTFIKNSKKWIEEFNARFSMIYCRVYDQNEFTRRWLGIMGFDENPDATGLGLHGERFIEFYRLKE